MFLLPLITPTYLNIFWVPLPFKIYRAIATNPLVPHAFIVFRVKLAVPTPPQPLRRELSFHSAPHHSLEGIRGCGKSDYVSSFHIS